MSQIQLTSSLLRAKADELSSQNEQLKAQINSLDETEQSLNAMWEGDSNTAFHAAFQSDKVQMSNFYNAIQQYIQVLRAAADRYARAEGQNVEIANTRKY